MSFKLKDQKHCKSENMQFKMDSIRLCYKDFILLQKNKRDSKFNKNKSQSKNFQCQQTLRRLHLKKITN